MLCLQETKLSDDAFPHLSFSALGYDSVHNGQGQWNGVAILSRVGIDDPVLKPMELEAFKKSEIRSRCADYVRWACDRLDPLLESAAVTA